MKDLDDFLNQELEAWFRIPMGHLIGAVAILCSIPTLFMGRAFVIDLFTADYGDRFATGIAFLICALITGWFFRVAYRLINDK